MKSRGLMVMDYPRYSPDLAPSDFGPFGTSKEKPRAYEIEGPEDLEQTTRQLLSEFDKDFFQPLFIAWIRRLEWGAEHGGEYFSNDVVEVRLAWMGSLWERVRELLATTICERRYFQGIL